MHAWSYARTQRETQRESSCCATVVWTRVWVCGGAALLSRATQRCVELCGHDSAIQGCIARSASWPSINLAGLICDWISMPPSNVAMVIRSRYQRRRRIENFGPAPPPPSTKSVILGGGSDPPSTKSVILGGGLTPPAPRKIGHSRGGRGGAGGR